MTKSDKFIMDIAEQIENKLPKTMELFKKNARSGILEITVIGAEGQKWPEATIKLDKTNIEVRCGAYIWPVNELPLIIKQELNTAARTKFPLSEIEIPFSELELSDKTKIVEDLYGAFCFYIEKIEDCRKQQLEKKIRQMIKKSLEL